MGDATKQSLTRVIEHFQVGRLKEAESVCKQILQVNPNQADALHFLGLVFHEWGQEEQALELIDRALRFVQTDFLYSNRGIVLRAMQRFEEAKHSYQRALAMNDSSAATHSDLGATLQALGELDAAIDSFRKALSLDPQFSLACSGLGLTFILKGDHEQALKHLQQAVAIDPSLLEAHINLGALLWSRNKLEDATMSYRAALQLNPSHLPTLDNLGLALRAMNRMEEAADVYQTAYALAPCTERRIQCLQAISHVHQSVAELLEERATFESQLDDLINASEKVVDITPNLYCKSAFNLAFHGVNDKAIQQKLARLYEGLCPQLMYRAAHVDTEVPEGRRVRLGFLSKHIHNHPVAHCFAGLIEALSKQRDFEVFLISTQSLEGESVNSVYDMFSGSQVQIPADYLKARQKIADLELDILAYQDIGMDDLSYFLAFARLARHQCVMGGHPDTTGIPNVDYFISSALAEPTGAEAHYSETLIQLPIGTFFFDPPKLPSSMKSREEMGLPASGSLYVCPMMLQKIHPDFDEAVACLLQADPSGYVVFFEHEYAGWEKDLRRRFDRTIPMPQRERVLFLPWIKDYTDFVNLNALADVVLDPFHFGIGSTAIATFAVGTPIVTLPGEFMRGRVGLFYSHLLDVPEFVAVDVDDYVAKALRLATDREWRARVSEKIKAGRHLFYENQNAIDDLAKFFVGLVLAEGLPTQ